MSDDFSYADANFPDELLPDQDTDFSGVVPDLSFGIGNLNGVIDLSDRPQEEDLDFSFQEHEGLTSTIMRESSVVDQSWMGGVPESAASMFDHPHEAQEELEEAWGNGYRTTGVRLIPQVDRERVNYLKSCDPSEGSNLPQGPPPIVADAVRAAARRIASGESYASVANLVAYKLGHDAHFAKDAMEIVKDDVGLAGNVYIRASEYPNCAQGGWTKQVMAKSRVARYVVAKPDCKGCIHAKNGSCDIFKKKLVAAVPWKEALQVYTPVLEATGRTVDMSKTPKESLRLAFLSAPGRPDLAPAIRQIEVHPADTISFDEAVEEFHKTESVVHVVAGTTWEQVHKNLERWASKGMLSKEDLTRLKSSFADPTHVLKAAAALITLPESRKYAGLDADGVGRRHASRGEILASLRAAESKIKESNTRIANEMSRRAFVASPEGKRIASVEHRANQVVKHIEHGLRGRALVSHILRTFPEDERGLAATILEPVIKMRQALKEPDLGAKPYSGIPNSDLPKSVTAKEAWEQLQAVHLPDPIDISNRQIIAAHNRMVATLDRWVKGGLITKAAGDKLAASDADPVDVLRIGSALITKSKTGSYSGLYDDRGEPKVDEAQVWAALRVAEDSARKINQAVQDIIERRVYAQSREGLEEARQKQLVEAAQAQVRRWFHTGLLSEDDTKRILASSAPPKDMLRVASALASKSKVGGFTGIRGIEVPSVSRDEAWRMLKSAEDAAKVAEDRIKAAQQAKDQARSNKVREAAQAQVRRWFHTGLLSEDDTKRILASSASPKDMLRVASALASKSKVGGFTGIRGIEVPSVSRDEAWRMLKSAEDTAKAAEGRIKAAQQAEVLASVGRRLAKLAHETERGLPLSALKGMVARMFSASETERFASEINAAISKVKSGAVPRIYEGPIVTPNSHFASDPKAPRPAEIQRLVRWARQKMSEGIMGNKLDRIMSTTFPQSVRTASTSDVKLARDQHEGLSGKIYVDAEAYASTVGVSGCTTAAMKHRSSSVRMVLEMPRCKSCVHKVAMLDGSSSCGLYKKLLIKKEALAGLGDLRRENIEKANEPDPSYSISMNEYDPKDFGLHQSRSTLDTELDQVEEVAEVQEIDENVFFGGMYI